MICKNTMYAANIKEAEEMAEAAVRCSRERCSMCGYQYRRVQAIDEAKKIIDSGAIGELSDMRAQYLQSWSAESAFSIVLEIRKRNCRSRNAR
ncbi:MAG: hypothetical protein V8R80_12915 [Eubacterium sp.]